MSFERLAHRAGSTVTLSRPLARVAVTTDCDTDDARAATRALAQELGLPLVAVADADEPFDLLLCWCEHGLELRERGRGGSGPITVDFVGRAAWQLRKSNLSRRQPIAVAVGLRRGLVTLVDATAGLARDSFLLAALGCTVIAVERSPLLGVLLRDGLARANLSGPPRVRTIVDRISLVIDDARDVLRALPEASRPDVVYIDPMYPPKRKVSLPKKEMRICRQLVGDDPDAGELFEVARSTAKRRVVVKRHRHAPLLAPNPSFQVSGKQARYDVYQPGA